MNKALKSTLLAWVALILVVLILCLSFSQRGVWWAYIDIFFAFMMCFIHLMAVYMGKKLPTIGKQLDMAAFVCGCLALLAYIIEFFLFQ